MFPSCGLFANINCPSTKRGRCERPHCFYKHGIELQYKLGASFKSPVFDSAGVQKDNPYDVRGAPVNDVTADDCLQQLERLNKEIETVRHEVEQERRRLSHYQTVQVDNRNTEPSFSTSKSETARKNVDRNSYGLSSFTESKKKNSRARKYVVDNSKPRTDLEYDPLSNFSADLRSYSTSGKEQKVRDEQGLKRARNAICCNQKLTKDYQAPLSRSPSPDPLGDSYEDSELVIDISLSPERKSRKVKEFVEFVSDKSPTQERITESNESVIFLDSLPLQVSKTLAVSATPLPAPKLQENVLHSNCRAEKSQKSEVYENEDCEIVLVKGSVNITGCLEDLGRESQKVTHFQAAETLDEKSPEPTSPPTARDLQDQNLSNLVVKKRPQCELSCSVKKMNPLQPYDYLPKNSLFYKTPEVLLNRQHANQTQAQNRVHDQQSNTNCSPSLLPQGQKTSDRMIGQAHHHPPERYLEPEEMASYSNQAGAQRNSSASSLTNQAESSISSECLSVKADAKEVIIIESSSDEEADEFNFSEIELSDSDPMEECYRIFMEAEVKASEQQPDVPVGVEEEERPELNVTPQPQAGRKRVAHEVKNTEQPVAKSRPQPKVLVPWRGPAVTGFPPQPSITANIQQVQQRASILTASVKGGQDFALSTCQRKQETQSAPSSSIQNPENLQLAPLQNAYIKYIPLETAVINVGNNLHLILPQGTVTLPVTSSSSQVSSVLTPVTRVHPNHVTVRQAYNPVLLTPVQRYRSTAPMIIPAQARKRWPISASAAAHSVPAASTPQAAVQSTAKPVATKRKSKQQSEAAKDKVPHDIRQRYVNLFTEELLKTSANVNDAFEKALAEEKTVYNRSMNKLKYLSVAVNALKRLKNQSAAFTRDQNKVNSQSFKGRIPLNLEEIEGNDDMPFYDSFKDYILTEGRMIESNYPLQHPEKPGSAVLFSEPKKGIKDPLKRICCRCGATYSVSQTGKHVRKEECNYHYGKGVNNRVPGGVETRYSCCEGVMGAPGCQVFKLHVHDSLSLDGFVSTSEGSSSGRSCPGVYSLDCEMCYTIHGLELSRVTVVNSRLQVIYDTFIRPDNEVIDYNTRFSGMSEEDVKDTYTSLREVQETLLSFINADTILIGHSLETDLCALKLLHGTVVDTSVVFPHRLGPPHKLSLNKLTADYLRRIIQQSECGHDTAEDAAACMELMLWKAKEDGKLKK
ncbi:RNA exonuclease 1 homolog isoform X2 [Notolabrus celidotus]|uniref:RNA exonuclease 1 homolog isoform X2 n=1 Tax=Notolabrus celidotus TaxID=1203425 RepID=UPI001490756F|nr:RNA exonuclease 1 homolog isoform X2 [Notolabrus celidotus]